jgi:flavin reductase (DIM6/NTAB) family NADH-FMN oxidoreductase RutF
VTPQRAIGAWPTAFLGVFGGLISAIHPGGDHQIVVGEVVEIATADPAANAKPLLFFCGRYAAVAE